jgi:hypothetical protein
MENSEMATTEAARTGVALHEAGVGGIQVARTLCIMLRNLK